MALKTVETGLQGHVLVRRTRALARSEALLGSACIPTQYSDPVRSLLGFWDWVWSAVFITSAPGMRVCVCRSISRNAASVGCNVHPPLLLA